VCVLCGLVCPSRTSERGGEGDCVKEGGRRREVREGACIGAATMLQPWLDIEVDPQHCCLGSLKSDFALQANRNDSDRLRCDGIPAAVKCASEK
jgi:hypothetical protein